MNSDGGVRAVLRCVMGLFLVVGWADLGGFFFIFQYRLWLFIEVEVEVLK